MHARADAILPGRRLHAEDVGPVPVEVVGVILGDEADEGRILRGGHGLGGA
jgi:hypothetical protein